MIGTVLAAWTARASRAAFAVSIAVAASTAPAAGTADRNGSESRSASVPPLHLSIRYASFSIGRDGVERETRYANRMLRTADTVWIEREWPAALRESAEHGHSHANEAAAGHGTNGAGHRHAHDETLNAPLLLQRDADGRVDVQSVLRDRRRVIHVDLAHHGNVGYGGSWPAAWSLIDPRALDGMTRIGTARNGVQRYESREAERTTRIDWDVAGRYARQISVRDAHGTSWRTMTATPRPMPAELPWQALGAYSQGDYSDLLD
ncbi:MAG: hypothetical protein QM766_09410 [Burkholderiaceae bacterium]